MNVLFPKDVHHLFETKTRDELIEYFACGEERFQYYLDLHEKGMETYTLSLCIGILVWKETNESIGECGFHTWNKKHNRAEVFYALNKEEFKNKGIMSEVLPLLLQFGFQEMNLHRIQAMISKENTPSYKLLQKNGFNFEGTAREDYVVDGKNENSECYSLLKWEYIKGT